MQVRLIVPNVFPNTIESYGPEIADIAGGFTATLATGGWKDSSGSLLVEPVTVFDCNDETVSHWGPEAIKDDWRSLAKRIADELSQDCVYLSFDGRVEYITK